MLTFAVDSKASLDQLALALTKQELLPVILDSVGRDVVTWLKSYTNEWRPPARQRGNKRRAHPGHWGDVTRDLMSKYAYRVVREPHGWRLELTNTSDHAIFLDARDGFFVLRGVMDRGGPVDKKLREVVARVAPGWRIV